MVTDEVCVSQYTCVCSSVLQRVCFTMVLWICIFGGFVSRSMVVKNVFVKCGFCVVSHISCN